MKNRGSRISARRPQSIQGKHGPLIIAEVAQAHDGSLGMAHAFIDAAARAGADAIKFQTHIAAAESGATDPWRVKFSLQDKTRYDYWRRMEFTEEQWAGLRRHADERKLYFLSSPFSVEAVDLLQRVGVAAWKIASGEVNNIPMFDRMAETGLPMLISTGMSPLKEIDAAVSRARSRQVPVTVFQCTSAYPCPPDKVGLNLIPFFRERYSCGVGLSDHSGTIFAGLAACALGVDAIETHVTFSREMFGPDVMASITLDELRQLVEGVRFIMAMLRSPLDKDVVAKEMQPLRNIFMKSVVVTQNLSAGARLRVGDLTGKKPGTGIPVSELTGLVGRTLRRSVQADHMLEEADLLPQVAGAAGS